MDIIKNRRIENVLKELGFSDQAIVQQTKKLGEILQTSLWVRIIKEKDVNTLKEKPTQEEMKKFLADNYSNEEIEKIIREESEKLLGEYLKEITKDVPEEKLVKIEAILKAE